MAYCLRQQLNLGRPPAASMVLAAVATCCAAPAAAAAPPTLVDHPIASGQPPLYLDGDGWTVTNTLALAVRLNASVPGDILTDLTRAGRVPNAYHNMSWQTPGFIGAWNQGTWRYKTAFVTPPAAAGGGGLLLVFDGIRMGAVVELNGHWLGNVTDQFLRYEFALTVSQLRAPNELCVSFGAELLVATGGRFTRSGQIDWAPVSPTHDPTDAHRTIFGFGIWKSVYVVSLPASTATIAQFGVQTFFAGGHPTSLLPHSGHAGFNVSATLDLLATTACSGTVSVLGSWPGAVRQTQRVSLRAGTTAVTLALPAEQTRQARLWHPNGHGAQVLYSITANFAPDGSGAVAATTSRRIGFRHIALVTTDDTDAHARASAARETGTGQRTMFFRVNGAPLYARGGNKIPMELLEGRMTAVGHRRLVQSAADAHFTMLRIWGGAIWETRAFYDACDEFGILLYHDLQIAAKNNYSLDGGRNYNTVVPRELRYQLARNSHHPSIAMYDGCNECALMTPGAAGSRFAKMGMAVVRPKSAQSSACMS
jgi:beta-galactosidase/beta-glucuronidase